MNDIQDLKRMIGEAVEHIRSKSAIVPRVGIICGTGMGALADKVESATVIPYDEIPHFPVSTVESHHGNLALGRLAGQNVFVMQGRFHFYEGYSMRQITFPERVMKALGCDTMIVMNATGSMNPFIGKGSIVFIHDQINMMGQNPLVGPNDDSLGPRFPDMSEPYSRALIALAEDVALKAGIRTHRGVCIAVTGPNLETAAEYRAFRRMGADIVTMSTIPEVIVANHAGMKVLGISTVTDECYPDCLKPADIGEIIAVAQSAEPKLNTIVQGVLARLDEARS
ncbi:MAG: Purine nucleoside phosphorylase 1 [candidate division BRC1 bacterium ADurb.BinA364]|nr:MAG: Purine nucleoside phosphorylase 1 [candidate division BRC1 bacterium ADurb.BinA364]